MEIEGIDNVLRHKHTTTKGCWSIMTYKQDFRRLVPVIKEQILLLAKFYQKEDPDSSLPSVGLAFNYKQKRHQHRRSTKNINTPSTSSPHKLDDKQFTSPDTQLPNEVSQQKTPVPDDKSIETSTTALTTDSDSTGTLSEFQEILQQNEKLQQQVDSLSEMVIKLQAVPSEITVQKLTAAVVKSFQEQSKSKEAAKFGPRDTNDQENYMIRQPPEYPNHD